jgi:hypothetical protein
MKIDKELAAMKRMTVTQLRQRYAEVFGEPTNGHNKPWLVRRIAWRLQERAEGGLSERARRRAEVLADDADLRVVPAKPRVEANPPRPAPAKRDRRLPPPGSTITRRYKGKQLEVKVLADGFEHDGTVHRSLSAVAKAITGSHLNGLAFFGLAAKGAKL